MKEIFESKEKGTILVKDPLELWLASFRIEINNRVIN